MTILLIMIVYCQADLVITLVVSNKLNVFFRLRKHGHDQGTLQGRKLIFFYVKASNNISPCHRPWGG